MKLVDRLLQKWRIIKAGKHIPDHAKVLDIGSWQGELADQISKIDEYWGVDPKVEENSICGRKRLVKGYFPHALPAEKDFNAVTLLAVLEHVPREEQLKLARDIAGALAPQGKIIITVPSPIVDSILAILKKLRIIDGMSLDEHYGFQVDDTPQIFETDTIKLVHRSRFQLGCNNLFVFQRIV